ncbi:single-stranded DNA-binding protein [Rhizobium phage RHph_Y2_17_1]|nr:single-stranded DNA-binding protein [Rhizobium phage RHph_Y2_11]QIG75829.1 single-stranded DNA-binding protein [Rhizobium phage RHph_Y2_17_1]
MALSPALQKLVANGANKYQRSTGERIKPKEGINRYRILVPDVNAQFWADLGVHWIKPEVEGKGKPIAVVGCSDVCFGQPCEIDTAINAALSGAIDEDSKKLYESWRARKTVLLNVLDRSKGSTDPDKVQILEITTGTFGAILNIVQQYAEEGEDILDAAVGMDISISRTGKGLQTEYTVNVAPGKSQPVTKAHLKDVHNLTDHINKEFFRGDEQKALNFIGQVAQVNLPRLGNKTPTAALTSKAAQVDPEVDADALADAADLDDSVPFDTEEEAPVTKAAARTAPSKPAVVEEEPVVLDDNDIDDVLADLDSI